MPPKLVIYMDEILSPQTTEITGNSSFQSENVENQPKVKITFFQGNYKLSMEESKPEVCF